MKKSTLAFGITLIIIYATIIGIFLTRTIIETEDPNAPKQESFTLTKQQLNMIENKTNQIIIVKDFGYSPLPEGYELQNTNNEIVSEMAKHNYQLDNLETTLHNKTNLKTNSQVRTYITYIFSRK